MPLISLILSCSCVAPTAQAQDLAATYIDAIEKINEEHLRAPGKEKEADLGKRLPQKAQSAFDHLLKQPDSPSAFEALLTCGETALDLDLMEHFEQVRARLAKSAPEHAKKLGIGISRPRFLMRGLGGVQEAYLKSFADVLEAVLKAYDEVFGFEEWSKVPGKKLRVRVHLEADAKSPPHFAPQFQFHSEIDFPITDSGSLKSPTPDGRFLLYGLCHELGHVIAMWGDRNQEEDHHSFAHYTGVVIVERLAETCKGKPFMKDLDDARWRSLSIERKQLKGKKPSLDDKDGVLALLIALHDRVGARAIGQALNFLDRENRCLRINNVRYYSFKELKKALLETIKDPKKRRDVLSTVP